MTIAANSITATDSTAAQKAHVQAYTDAYATVRRQTQALADGLSAEDQVVQSMPDASPMKWHQAHTTWFFEQFILTAYQPHYRLFHPRFSYIFNSYYEAVGDRHARPQRGMLTRPSLQEVADYRAYVDQAMTALLREADTATLATIAPLLTLGLNHEQQHQELMMTDLLHAFACSPLKPAYRPHKAAEVQTAPPQQWLSFDGGIRRIGHEGDEFSFDHEGPRHDVLLRPFRLASHPVTNAAWKDFIADGGYSQATLWLSDGWAQVQQDGWQAPLYWQAHGDDWQCMTLNGLLPVDDTAPVCHISYYEADAFACWAGKRLPREDEWEVAAQGLPVTGNILSSGMLRPLPATTHGRGPQQMFGDVWEWTQSPYAAYPGYRVPDGAVSEYNGKFMCNQMVLRGGSCVTPAGHLRACYRNFFHPHQRWQFSGVRLAEDA